MPQSKIDYQTSGQRAAKEGHSREAAGLKEGSWQHRAWLVGYDSAPKSKATTISDLALRGPEPRVVYTLSVISTMGPLYPPKVKARSKRPGGWTGVTT